MTNQERLNLLHKDNRTFGTIPIKQGWESNRWHFILINKKTPLKPLPHIRIMNACKEIS